MQIKIKDDRILEEISRSIKKTPDAIINELIESLDLLPDEIIEECKDVSFRDVMSSYFFDSMDGRKLKEALSEVLGKYRYHIQEMDFDFRHIGFNFVIHLQPSEKRINIDEIGLGITPINIEMLVLRTVEGVRLDSRTLKVMDDIELIEHPKLNSLEEELNRKIRDPDLWHNFLGNLTFEQDRINKISLSSEADIDNAVVIGITVKEENLANLPALEDLNKVLDLAERIVLDLSK